MPSSFCSVLTLRLGHRGPPVPPMRHSRATSWPLYEGISPSTRTNYVNGVNAVSRLYELYQQEKIRGIEWFPICTGPDNDKYWKSTLIGEKFRFSL